MPELHQQPFVLVVNTVAHGAAHAYVAKQITLYDNLKLIVNIFFSNSHLSFCRYENGSRDQKVTKEVMLSFERVRLSIRYVRAMWEVVPSSLDPFQRAV